MIVRDMHINTHVLWYLFLHKENHHMPHDATILYTKRSQFYKHIRRLKYDVYSTYKYHKLKEHAFCLFVF